MVVALLLQVPVYVHRSVFVVGTNVGINLFCIEVSHRSQFASRALQRLFGEQIAWLCAQFAAHNVLVKAVVTIDAHLVKMRLLAFNDTHFKVDGVANDVHFGGLQVIKQVAVVPILVSNRVFVFRQALVQQLLVVHVALLHAQNGRQIVG